MDGLNAREAAEVRRLLLEARVSFGEAANKLHRKEARRQEEREQIARLIRDGMVKLTTLELRVEAWETGDRG